MSKEGMPSDWEPVGTVLGENKTCACGGNPFGYDHAHSLGHVEWAWRNGYAEKQDIDVAPYVPGRWN